MTDISEKHLGEFILITLKERTNPSPASNSPLASVLSQGSLKEKEGDPAREYEQDVWDEKHTCKKAEFFVLTHGGEKNTGGQNVLDD